MARTIGRPQLEDLYRRFAPLVHAKALRLVGDDEADDVVQEVFLRLMRRGPEDEAAMVDWLCTATTNLALDRLRFLARRGVGWQGAVRDQVGAGRPADLESALALRDTCGKLLAELDRDSQQVAVLVHLEEMTQDEAARALKVTRRTVGNQ
ncbi:MAG: RNA polymerase sigma factor [Myxococcaceae bacterium]